MHYSTILLDLDHTLFDTDTSEATAFALALGAAGIAAPGRYIELYQRINIELWSAVERGEAVPQQVRLKRFERLVEQAKLNADPILMADVFVAALGANGDLYPGARNVLERLGKHASLALVTNGLSEVQRSRIERLGIGRYFDAIIISAEIGASKPGAVIFDTVFEQLDFPARESALMVGDNLSSDIQGGWSYGIATCWYNPEGKIAAQADRITHEISRLDELLRLVDQEFVRG